MIRSSRNVFCRMTPSYSKVAMWAATKTPWQGRWWCSRDSARSRSNEQCIETKCLVAEATRKKELSSQLDARHLVLQKKEITCLLWSICNTDRESGPTDAKVEGRRFPQVAVSVFGVATCAAHNPLLLAFRSHRR